MTTEDKIKLIELMQYTFTNSNSIIGYYVTDTFTIGDYTNEYTAELFEYSKSGEANPKVIYKQTTHSPKDKSSKDCQLDFYSNVFMLLPAGLGFVYEAINHQEPKEEMPELSELPTASLPPFLNQMDEKGVPAEQSATDIKESFIVDCDTEREPVVQILPILRHTEETEKLEGTYEDSRGVVTALCYALASMIRSVEKRELEDPGKSMKYAMDLVEDLYTDPNYEQV